VTVKAELPEGATPLDPDETEGLIPTHVTTQGALNEWEQGNILEAERWALGHKRNDILSMRFLLDLHRRMFRHTWKWGGTIRKTEKTIGVAVEEIRSKLADLFADAKYWIEHQIYEPDELAARFHHRLVQIHPFTNGNGRHARLMADTLLFNLNRPQFSWGGTDLYRKGEARDRYLAALRAADGSQMNLLLAFVRS
jgi:Fic-DOC domain mobile mystery protein B